MIYYFAPFATDKNLGAAYNHYMSLLPNDDDYACFTDADTQFLLPDYGLQLEKIVKSHKDAGMFTCLTNRVGNVAQCLDMHLSTIPDVCHHKRLAKAQWNKYGTFCQRLSKPISGMMMLLQKKVWNNVKFQDGLLTVDNKISGDILKAGYPVYLMKGIYIFHYYRLLEGSTYKKHLL